MTGPRLRLRDMTVGQQVAYVVGMVLFVGSVLAVAALVAGLMWRLIKAVWGIE